MYITNEMLLDVPKWERLLYYSHRSMISFGKIFLAGDFLKSDTPAFHEEIGKELDSDSTKPFGIFLPRGSAKTTLVKCSIVHDFCFSKENLAKFASMSTSILKEYWFEEAKKRYPYFHAWVAKTQDDSKENVSYIRKHLESNKLIIQFFGKLKGPVWNQEEVVTKHGDRLISSSNLKSIRGRTEANVLSGTLRFSRVFADDFENEINTKTLASREEIKKVLLAAIMPAIEKDRPRCRLIVIGTPVHFDSFIQNMINSYIMQQKIKDENYSWKIIFYRSTQPSMPGGVLWNSYMPREILDKKKKELEDAGKINLYYQEYELEVQTEESSVWTRSHIRFHSKYYIYENGRNFITEDGVTRTPVNIFIGCDPATDIKTRLSDYSAFSVIAIDSNNKRYALHTERHRSMVSSGMRDDNGELIGKPGSADTYISLYDEYHATGGAIENTAISRSIFQDLNKLKIKLNKPYIVVTPMKPGGEEKHNRIYSYMNVFFSQRLVYYKEDMYNLIYETINIGQYLDHDDEIESFYIANRVAYPPKRDFVATVVHDYDDYTILSKPKSRADRPWTTM